MSRKLCDLHRPSTHHCRLDMDHDYRMNNVDMLEQMRVRVYSGQARSKHQCDTQSCQLDTASFLWRSHHKCYLHSDMDQRMHHRRQGKCTMRCRLGTLFCWWPDLSPNTRPRSLDKCRMCQDSNDDRVGCVRAMVWVTVTQGTECSRWLAMAMLPGFRSEVLAIRWPLMMKYL